MKSISIKVSLFTVVLLFSMTCMQASVWAKDPINTNWRGLAIKGYDPVAYFTMDKPVKGEKDFEIDWKGAKWRFSSAEHLNRFRDAPEKYAPRYGGY